MTSSMAQAAVVEGIRKATSQVRSPKDWVVVVCPDGSEFLTTVRNCAQGVMPPGSALTGRTAILPGGGRLSIVAVSDDLFVPAGVPFLVVFLGWGDDIAADNRKMQVWREKASEVLR